MHDVMNAATQSMWRHSLIYCWVQHWRSWQYIHYLNVAPVKIVRLKGTPDLS